MTEALGYGRMQLDALREIGSIGAGMASAVLAQALTATTGRSGVASVIDTVVTEGNLLPAGRFVSVPVLDGLGESL